MQIGKGVEWAAHACTLLAALPKDWALPAEALAAYHDVPPAYMAKQMQALARAGLVVSRRGAAGGYRLAKPALEITLWDITAALEGSSPAFRCTEIRQNGPCGSAPEACRTPCAIAASFHAAEAAFRDSLKTVSLFDVMTKVAGQSDPAKNKTIVAWIEENATRAEG
ncbi:MAG: Rrf2 family transcriptional regulator [Pseudomonadota bacterium]